MDAFFASVEQRDFAELRGKPVAVGGSSERGVVAAASYEARKFGVRSAMASRIAKQKCPNLIFVKPRFEVYKQVSNEIREIFLEYTSLVEPLSLDEAYLDVTENLKGMATATEIAQEIKMRIKEKTMLTASAGVSINKFLAKIASDYRKPDGLFVIKPLQAETFVAGLEISKFHGIGKVTAEKMHKMGIFSGKELREKSLDFLTKHFGKVGKYYFDIASGVDNRPVNPDSIRKSIGVENTFNHDIFEPDELYLELDEIIEQLWRRMERANAFGKSITLKLKFADFESLTRSRTSQLSVIEKSFLAKVSYEMLNNLLPLPKGVRLMGVSFTNLEFADEMIGRQLTLGF